MPYIPPPPRPYIPPPPRPPAPPRIHNPSHNIHMQQQQRFQQQQQQQQRFQQQQDQQRRFHQNIIMENQRRHHQQQQQQLQRQQQALHFQRQQEQLRRQQQDHHRRQQQLAQDQHRRQQQFHQQQDQRRQQEFLRNFQKTAALSGATVVNIAPSEDLSDQQEGADLQVAAEGAQGVTIELNMTGLTSSTTSAPPPAHPPPTLQASTGPPPPYQQSIPDVQTAPPLISTSNEPAPPPLINAAPPPPVVIEKREPPDNTIALKDGTVIVIKSEDEILFKGPTGVEMIVNCLPLYEMPLVQVDEQESDSDTEPQSVAEGNKISNSESYNSPGKKKSVLIKARSAEALDLVGELEMHDQDDRDVKLEEESLSQTVPVARKWSRLSAAYSKNMKVRVHKGSLSMDDLTCEEGPKSTSSLVQTRSKSTENVVKDTKGDKVSTKQGETEETLPSSVSTSPQKELEATPPPPPQQAEHSTTPEIKLPDEALDAEEEAVPIVEVQEDHQNDKLVQSKEESVVPPQERDSPRESRAEPAKKTHLKKRGLSRSVKSASPTNDLDNGSDEDGEKGLTVNYLDPFTMSTLKRGSGSVSFYTRPKPVAVQKLEPMPQLEASKEKEEDEDESAKENESPIGEDANSSLQEAKAFLSQADASPSAPPPQATAMPLQASVQVTLIPSALPLAPPTLDLEYIENSGWLNKLSHRKGVFGDKWQKRYFVLHRSWLYYFKKYGDSNPRGVIRLLPCGWTRPVSQGSARMADAVLKANEQTSGIISVHRCIAVHRPSNFSASLCDLLANDGVAETFRSQTISVSNSQHSSRTYYMVAPSDQERERWVELVNKNRRAYAHSSEALTTACKELKIMLRAVNSTIPPKHIPSLLCLLYSKKKALSSPAPRADSVYT